MYLEGILKEIKIDLTGNDQQPFSCVLENDNSPYSKWLNKIDFYTFLVPAINFINDNKNYLENTFNLQEKYENDPNKLSIEQASQELKLRELVKSKDKILQSLQRHSKMFAIREFIIYSPENQALRTFEKEGQIQPLGINGEGLFKLLKVLSSDNQEQLNEIKKKLKLIDWFQDFEASPNLSNIQNSLQIKDRYLDPDLAYFDQRSSNEGFLFLLFYFALFISDITPKFFAIDNIDASLNPRLCRRLIQELVELAKKHDKQVIFTTHNPAVLDGLDLDDDEQRLLVIYRNQLGHTKARRILKPKPLEGQEPVRLSEAFLRGYIGGLPKNF